MKLIILAIFTIFVAVNAQSATTVKPATSLSDLSKQLMTIIKSFAADGEKQELFRTLRTQTGASIDLMKKNDVKVTSDDINKMVDDLKAQLKADTNAAIQGEGINRFGGHLRDHLMRLLAQK